MSGGNVDLNNHFYTKVSVFTVLCENILLQEININCGNTNRLSNHLQCQLHGQRRQQYLFTCATGI